MKSLRELHELVVKHFGGQSSERFFKLRKDPDICEGVRADSCFITNFQAGKSYRFYFAIEPGVAAIREVDGTKISLNELIQMDMKVYRIIWGTQVSEPVVTAEYGIFSFCGKSEVRAAATQYVRRN